MASYYDDFDRSQLTTKQDYMLDQRARRRAMLEAAHDDAMAQHRRNVERNPYSYSHFERDAVLGKAQREEDRAAMRKHELDMLRQQGANELAVQKEKTIGGQVAGAGAAAENRLGTEAEAAAKRSAAEAQYGRLGADGTYIAGSDVTAATTAADRKLEGSKYEADKRFALEQAKLGSEERIAEGKRASALEVAQEETKRARESAQVDWNQRALEHERKKELLQAKMEGLKMSEAESKLWMLEQNKPENKDKTLAQWLKEVRGVE